MRQKIHQLWQNWAKTQACIPETTFYPKTLDDLVEIVRQAHAKGKKISVAGRGHTMGPLSLSDEYLVVVSELTKISAINPDNCTVTVEAGVTIGELDTALRPHKLAVPTNVVLTWVRYGGVIATGCHGAGWDQQTLSDLVESMTIVTYTGEVVTYSEATHGAEMMNAVRCNLGTFGIIYQITLRVEQMFNLTSRNQHMPMSMVENLDQLKAYLTENDYVEAFWFPLSPGIWAKSWNRTSEPAQPRPAWTTPYEYLTTRIGTGLLWLITKKPRWTRAINTLIYHTYAPKDCTVVQDAVDAQHYRQFIEFFKCYIMSFSVKIDPDFENVRKAWMLVVNKVLEYEKQGHYPLNLVLEMRVIRNSRVLLSPVYGEENEHHCYFEVISYHHTPGAQEFFNEIAQAWMAMPELHARPHWAKYFYEIPGIIPHIRQEWGDNLTRFAEIRDEVDPERMFINPKMEKIFYD